MRGRHDDRYEPTHEDVAFIGGPDEVRETVTRADMVYAKSPGGGAVFSVGSMGWSIALWHLADVERVTENVLDHFVKAE